MTTPARKIRKQNHQSGTTNHANARTLPAIRLELQSQPESVSDRELAEAYHLNRHTVAKWRRATVLPFRR